MVMTQYAALEVDTCSTEIWPGMRANASAMRAMPRVMTTGIPTAAGMITAHSRLRPPVRTPSARTPRTTPVIASGAGDTGAVTRAPSLLRMPDGCSLKGLGGGRGDGQVRSLVEGQHDTAALGPPGVADRHQEDAPQSAS